MKLVEALPEMVNDIAGALIRAGRGELADQLREVSVARWTYDKSADAAYVYVDSPRPLNVVDRDIIGVRHGETVSLYDELGINVDLDNHHRVTGVEILEAGHIANHLANIAVQQRVGADLQSSWPPRPRNELRARRRGMASCQAAQLGR